MCIFDRSYMSNDSSSEVPSWFKKAVLPGAVCRLAPGGRADLDEILAMVFAALSLLLSRGRI